MRGAFLVVFPYGIGAVIRADLDIRETGRPSRNLCVSARVVCPGAFCVLLHATSFCLGLWRIHVLHEAQALAEHRSANKYQMFSMRT